MKHLNIVIMAAMLVGVSVFSSCSKDDGTPVVILPSRVIEQVKIYKGKSDEYKLATVLAFKYVNSLGLLAKVESDSPFWEVNYTYEDNQFSYSYISEMNGTNKVTSTLINGRIGVCQSDKFGNSMYTYDDKTGFISQVLVGGDIILNYKWLGDGMNLEASSNSEPLVAAIYSSKYRFSDVPNDYNIDLNVLPQLIDSRKDYSLVMNLYAQAAGVLGKKCAYVMEPDNFTYGYSFDRSGRLAQLTVTPAIYGDVYTFVITYKKNNSRGNE